MPTNPVEFIMRERDWLVALLQNPGRVDPITEMGLDLTTAPPTGELWYRVPYGDFKITIQASDLWGCEPRE